MNERIVPSNGLQSLQTGAAYLVEHPATINQPTQSYFTLTIDPVTQRYGQGLAIRAHLVPFKNGPVPTTGTVSFTIDGWNVGSVAIKGSRDLTLSLPFSSVSQFHAYASHTILAKYPGDTNFLAEMGAASYYVTRSDMKFTSVTVTKGLGSAVTIGATVLDSYTSAPIAKRAIDVNVDNKFIGTYYTDANGKINVNYNAKTRGTHSLTIYFYTDGDYNTTSSFYRFTI